MASEGEAGFRRELVALLPRLRRFGRALTGAVDLADDLVQAACERALPRWRQYRPGTRLDRWMFAIMQSIWRNELRARRVRGGGEEPVDPDALAAPPLEPQLEARLLVSAVDRALAGLPEEQRAVLLLVGAEGLTYQEAADALGIPIGTVMSRLARGRLALARALAPGEAEAPSPKPRPGAPHLRAVPGGAARPPEPGAPERPGRAGGRPESPSGTQEGRR